MFDFLSFLIAIVALIVAAKAFNQVAALRQRIHALEQAAPRLQAAPPPLAPYLDQDFSILKVDGTKVTDTGKRFKVPGHPASARMSR